MSELLEKLKQKCTIRGLNDFTDEDLTDELEDAIEVVNNRRNFVPTSDFPYETKYASIIVKMALYSLAKMGAEGEVAHSENGIARSYASASDYPDDLLNQIIPRIRV